MVEVVVETKKSDRKEVRCPFCTQQVGTHPSGVMVPHTTRQHNQGSECWGSRRKP
jgi:C4-type Zn-finger protein